MQNRVAEWLAYVVKHHDTKDREICNSKNAVEEFTSSSIPRKYSQH